MMEDLIAGFMEDLRSLESFSVQAGDQVKVEALEIRVPATLDRTSLDIWRRVIEPQAEWLRTRLFFEIGWENWQERLRTLRSEMQEAFGERTGFKWRCGGSVPADYPSPETLAAVFAECKRIGADWKATAGLHHPLPRPDASGATTMQGFLNVLAAPAFGFPTEQQTLSLLRCDEPGDWSFGEKELKWRGVALPTKQILSARRHFAMSFGSCSFLDPVEDSQAIGWLPS